MAVAEAKWTNKPLGQSVLTDLLTYKLPALAQAGFNVVSPEIVLASRSGFSAGLLTLAKSTPNTHTLTADDLLTDLVSSPSAG